MTYDFIFYYSFTLKNLHILIDERDSLLFTVINEKKSLVNILY